MFTIRKETAADIAGIKEVNDAAFQKEGVGSLLVNVGLKHCRGLGYDSVIVLGHPEFYPKFGFVPASSKGIKPPFEVLDEVFMLTELKPGALNAAAGVVKYPPAFMNV